MFSGRRLVKFCEVIKHASTLINSTSLGTQGKYHPEDSSEMDLDTDGHYQKASTSSQGG